MSERKHASEAKSKSNSKWTRITCRTAASRVYLYASNVSSRKATYKNDALLAHVGRARVCYAVAVVGKILKIEILIYCYLNKEKEVEDEQDSAFFRKSYIVRVV